MPLFNWTEKYSVGVNIFDSHHKTFVGLINELHDAMRDGKARDILGEVLKRTFDYARMHFAEEERQMTTFGFSSYTAHKVEHEKLLAKVSELMARFDAGENTITIEVVNFLKDWLINHTLVTDKKYTKFFNDRGIV